MTKPVNWQVYRDQVDNAIRQVQAQASWDVRAEAGGIQNDVNIGRDDPYRHVQREMRHFGDYFDYAAAHAKAMQRLRRGGA